MHPRGSTTSAIHFIISKMVSAVRADATEVPTFRHKSSSTNGLPATGPQSGSKLKKKYFGKQFFRLHYDQKNTLNPSVKSVFKSVHNNGRYFVTATSALSNMPQRGVYNYARGRYFALGYALCSYF